MRLLRRPAIVLIGLTLLALVIRLAMIDRQALWADEAFSLAMATGHSLEHPAASADPQLGDFVQSPRPRPARELAGYLRHDTPIASPARVIRAVKLSDTNPPLYYLALWGWTILFGTSDATLRSFSVACSTLCMPLIWSIARTLMGLRAAILASLFFALSPLSIYYSTEGRMYAMMWLLALAATWLTLRLREARAAWLVGAGWAACVLAGLHTHYFFGFVLAGLGAFLIISPFRARRTFVFGLMASTGLLALPWYLGVPSSLSAWRVTSGWLEVQPRGFIAWRAWVDLVWSYFAPTGAWGDWGRLRFFGWGFVGVALLIASMGRIRRLWQPSRLILWMWLAGSLLGPVIFDLLRHTYTVHVSRYVLSGLPAALILLAMVVASLRRWPLYICVGLICAMWLPGTAKMWASEHRVAEPWRSTGRVVNVLATGRSVVIVHSIPSGVAGVSRYLKPDMPVAAWVGQLNERRVPEDMVALTRGYERVILVVTHALDAPDVENAWLDAHAKMAGNPLRQEAVLIYTYDMNQPSN